MKDTNPQKHTEPETGYVITRTDDQGQMFSLSAGLEWRPCTSLNTAYFFPSLDDEDIHGALKPFRIVTLHSVTRHANGRRDLITSFPYASNAFDLPEYSL